MADSLSSIPWHDSIEFLISTLGMVVQMHYPSSSPFDLHLADMWIFILCSFLYVFAYRYYIKCQIFTPADTTYLKLSFEIAIISRILACTALITMLVPPSLEPRVFIIYWMVIFIYFACKTIREICEDEVSVTPKLKKYLSDPSHVIKNKHIQLQENFSYVVRPERIVDAKLKQLRNKSIPLVKVIWKGPTSKEATWELEDDMKRKYPKLFL